MVSSGSQSHQQAPTCAENPIGETLKLPYQNGFSCEILKHWMSLFANLKCNMEFLESWGNEFMELQGNFMTINAKALTLPLWNRIPYDPNYWDNMKTGQHHYPSLLFPQLPDSLFILIPWDYLLFSYNSHLKPLIVNHIILSEFQVPVLISLQLIIFYHPTHSSIDFYFYPY